MISRVIQVCLLAAPSLAYCSSTALAQYPAPARLIDHTHARALNASAVGPTKTQARVVGQSAGVYPQFSAPLYPVPRQDIPIQVGGAYLTNQAIAPHEMLYAHEYRALYGPYYYSVKGGWFLTPFGMQSHEKWKLLGTEVRVKYRSRIGLLAKFAPPIAY